MPERSGRPRESKTRRAILERLKRLGPQDAATLARPLRITPMAVRQHLYDMEARKLVTSEPQPRPLGRPAKLWRLAPAAEDLFPDTHAELTVSLIAAVKRAFGQPGLDRLVAVRTEEQVAAYREEIPATLPLRRRLDALAAIRSREGYMAEVREGRDGTLLLIENHCPICTAATACTGLCAGELRAFQDVLGKGTAVERTDHIAAGARRCAYRVAPKP